MVRRRRRTRVFLAVRVTVRCLHRLYERALRPSLTVGEAETMNYARTLSRWAHRPRVHGYVSPDTITKKSPIHGLGLFAKEPLKRGSIVAVWGGKVIKTDELSKLPKKISSNYALEIHPGFYLAETSMAELDRSDFINHACNPNCSFIGLVMMTKRAIKKGKELTCDFSNKRGVPVDCRCGSKRCKGVVFF